jgi:hypothetical protein
MNDEALERLGPVDYLVVEFPAATQNFPRPSSPPSRRTKRAKP